MRAWARARVRVRIGARVRTRDRTRAMVRVRVYGSHAVHLSGVVVEEDEGGARKLETRGEAAQAGRLRAPVHLVRVRARVGVRAGVAG